MKEPENDFMRMWIYSYLRYGGIATPAQRQESKADFLKYLEKYPKAFRGEEDEAPVSQE